MRFKVPELKAEFRRSHPKVQALAMYLDNWAEWEFGKDLMVTDVERTQDEYDNIYHATPYLGPRPHLAPQSIAVDFRTVGELTAQNVDVMVLHANSWWPRNDGKPTALHHDVGNGQHLHIQIKL